MGRIVVLVYGLVAYAAFFASFTYAVGFVENLVVPKSIDAGLAVGPTWQRIVINALLLGVFAVQHTIMARPWFKTRITRIIPVAAERSTFVLVASAALALMMWQWRAMPEWALYRVEAEWARWALIGVSLAGFGIVFYASFLIDHFDLFGLRQVWFNLTRREYHHGPFMARSLYRFVRHPLMVGFLIGFWVTPDMTGGRLLFAGMTTAYILFGTTVEERDLVRFLGEDYLAYRRRTPGLVPFLKRGRRGAESPAPEGAA